MMSTCSARTSVLVCAEAKADPRGRTSTISPGFACGIAMTIPPYPPASDWRLSHFRQATTQLNYYPSLLDFPLQGRPVTIAGLSEGGASSVGVPVGVGVVVGVGVAPGL